MPSRARSIPSAEATRAPARPAAPDAPAMTPLRASSRTAAAAPRLYEQEIRRPEDLVEEFLEERAVPRHHVARERPLLIRGLGANRVWAIPVTARVRGGPRRSHGVVVAAVHELHDRAVTFYRVDAAGRAICGEHDDAPTTESLRECGDRAPVIPVARGA